MPRHFPIIQKSNILFSFQPFQFLRLFFQNQMDTQRYSRVSSSCDSQEGLIPSEQFPTHRNNSKINYFWRICLVANFLLLLCNVLFTLRRFEFHVKGTGAARNADYSKYEDQHLTINWLFFSAYPEAAEVSRKILQFDLWWSLSIHQRPESRSGCSLGWNYRSTWQRYVILFLVMTLYSELT